MISITDKGDHYVTDRSADYHDSNHITIHKCAKLTCGTLSIAVFGVKYISIKQRKNHLCYLGLSGKELTQTCQLLSYINDLEVFIKYSVFTNH